MMKRMALWMGLVSLATTLAACGGTLELGVEPGVSATDEVSVPLQADPTEEPAVDESVEAETPVEVPDGEASLIDGIVAALNSRDDAALSATVRDPFMIGLWRSEGFAVPPEDAPQQVYNYLPDGALVQPVTDPAAFPSLDGIDPRGMFGPEVAVEEVLYTTGWGEDGRGEALLFIASDADGNRYWHGMVIAPMGFGDLTVVPSSGWPVVDALNAGDESALVALMADPFAFGRWRSEWQTLTPAEALMPITDQLADGAVLEATADEASLPDLDGQPIGGMLGPEVTIEQVIFVTGWGPDGLDEALLFMVRSDSGDLVWQALLIAPLGFD